LVLISSQKLYYFVRYHAASKTCKTVIWRVYIRACTSGAGLTLARQKPTNMVHFGALACAHGRKYEISREISAPVRSAVRPTVRLSLNPCSWPPTREPPRSRSPGPTLDEHLVGQLRAGIPAPHALRQRAELHVHAGGLHGSHPGRPMKRPKRTWSELHKIQ